MAGAESRDDTVPPRVSVEPLPTHAALVQAAAVDGSRGVNVLAAPLAQWDLFRNAPLPLLPVRTRCRGRGTAGTSSREDVREEIEREDKSRR